MRPRVRPHVQEDLTIIEAAGRLLRYWRESEKGIPSPRLAYEFAVFYLRPSSRRVDARWLYRLRPASAADLNEIRLRR